MDACYSLEMSSDSKRGYGTWKQWSYFCLPADHRKNALLIASVVYLWSAGQNQN